jgi:hypothetical protein
MTAENADQYERIERMWRDADLWGRKVKQTPNLEDGLLSSQRRRLPVPTKR